MPREPVSVVQADGVGALEPSHAGNQIGIGGFQHQRVVIAHQAKRMHLPTGLLARLNQGADNVMPISST
jgi:hypothetical protein